MVDLRQAGLVAVVSGAFTVGTVLGFGTTILSVTFGAQLFEMDVLLPVVTPLNIGLSLYLAVRHRANTQWHALLRRILPLAALGVPLGMALFGLRGVGWLRLVFGVFVALIAALQLRASLRARTAKAMPITGWRRPAMLVAGGVVHGLYATAGPIFVYVLGREIEDKGAFRSTLATMFLPLTIALMVYYGWAGKVTPVAIQLSLMCIPGMLLGMWIGERVHDRVDQRRFKLAVWWLLLAGGLILTGRALLKLV